MNNMYSENFNKIIFEYNRFLEETRKYGINTNDATIKQDICKLLDFKNPEPEQSIRLLETRVIPKESLIIAIDELVYFAIVGHYFMVWRIHKIIEELYFKDEDYIVKLVDKILIDNKVKEPNNTQVYFVAIHLLYRMKFKNAVNRFLLKYKAELKDEIDSSDYLMFTEIWNS